MYIVTFTDSEADPGANHHCRLLGVYDSIGDALLDVHAEMNDYEEINELPLTESIDEGGVYEVLGDDGRLICCWDILETDDAITTHRLNSVLSPLTEILTKGAAR